MLHRLSSQWGDCKFGANLSDNSGKFNNDVLHELIPKFEITMSTTAAEPSCSNVVAERHIVDKMITPVIFTWPKGRISKQSFQKNKACQIFRKTKISYSPDTHTYVKNVCCSENLARFVFLKHLFWDSPWISSKLMKVSNTKNALHSLFWIKHQSTRFS